MIAAVIAMLALAAPVSAKTLSGDAATKALNAAGVGKTMFNGAQPYLGPRTVLGSAT